MSLKCRYRLCVKPTFRHLLQWPHNGVSNHRRLDCLLNRLFQTQFKENINGLRHWPVWVESPGDRWIPLTKDQYRGKCFLLITSSCYFALISRHVSRQSDGNKFRLIYIGIVSMNISKLNIPRDTWIHCSTWHSVHRVFKMTTHGHVRQTNQSKNSTQINMGIL